MKKSQLVNILNGLSAKEIREIRKWLHSPSHNLRQDVIQLFEYFFEDNHLNKEDYLEKPTIFSWIFPKETYDDAKMRQVIFFLLKAIEEFLVFQDISSDEVNMKITLAKVFRRKKLDKLFQKNIKQSEKLQEDTSLRNEKYFINEYSLQQEKYKYLGKKSRLPENLQQVSDNLDIFFLAVKLRQGCLMLSHQAVYKKEYEMEILERIIPIIQTEKYLKIPVIAFYYFIYKTITDKNNESHFENLKEKIKHNGHIFPLAEIRDIYLMAINYCIGKINLGKEKFVREAFELYKLGFEKKVLIEDNLISGVTFNNMVSSSLKLSEYQWVEVFINDYQQYLNDRHRKSYVFYNLARLHYQKKEYKEAMQLLVQDVQYDDILIFFTSKTLLSKMYYEEEEFDALESLIESMRTYVQRKKIMGYHKANFKNYIKFIKKLLRIKPNDKKVKEKLKKDIEEASPLTSEERKWLLTQLSKI